MKHHAVPNCIWWPNNSGTILFSKQILKISLSSGNRLFRTQKTKIVPLIAKPLHSVWINRREYIKSFQRAAYVIKPIYHFYVFNIFISWSCSINYTRELKEISLPIIMYFYHLKQWLSFLRNEWIPSILFIWHCFFCAMFINEHVRFSNVTTNKTRWQMRDMVLKWPISFKRHHVFKLSCFFCMKLCRAIWGIISDPLFIWQIQ